MFDDDRSEGVPEGFAGQRFAIIPNRSRAAAAPDRLTVMLAGWFPNAAHHAHARPNGAPECIVIVCFRGSGWCRMGGVLHHVSAGQALVIPPGVPHSYGASEIHPWTIGWVHLIGTGATDLMLSPGGERNPPVVTTNELDKAAQLLDEIITYLEREVTPATLAAAGAAAQHLMAVLNMGAHVNVDEYDPVRIAIAYLSSALDRAVTVDDVAHEAGLSRSHLAARFRLLTGESIGEYHTRLRMAKAALLLETTSAQVASVAARCGYADPNYFSRKFRNTYGVGPREFRRTRFS